MLTFDEQRLSGHVAPHLVAAIDRDEVGNLSTKLQIHVVPRVLDAHIDARSTKDQPHDAILCVACRHSSELEADDETSIWERVSIDSLSKAPQEERGIEIVGFDAVARVCQSPTTELDYHRTERVAGRCEPVLG